MWTTSASLLAKHALRRRNRCRLLYGLGIAMLLPGLARRASAEDVRMVTLNRVQVGATEVVLAGVVPVETCAAAAVRTLAKTLAASDSHAS